MEKRKNDKNIPEKQRPGNKPDRQPGNYPPGSEPDIPGEKKDKIDPQEDRN